MLLLEGADCTGKTTLASKLAERYGSPITHYSEHNTETMLKHAEDSKSGLGEIVDRFHLSEIPYSMYHRHTIPDYESVSKIGLELRKGKNLIIVCVPPWTLVKARWEERINEELVRNIEMFQSIYLWYRDKAQAFSPSLIWNYDYTLTSFNDLCKELTKWTTEYDSII